MAGFATLRPATWHFSLCWAAGILSRLQTATMVFDLNLTLLSMIPPFARHRQETTKALQNPGQHLCSGPSHSGRNLQDRGRLLDHTQTFLLPHLPVRVSSPFSAARTSCSIPPELAARVFCMVILPATLRDDRHKFLWEASFQVRRQRFEPLFQAEFLHQPKASGNLKYEVVTGNLKYEVVG